MKVAPQTCISKQRVQTQTVSFLLLDRDDDAEKLSDSPRNDDHLPFLRTTPQKTPRTTLSMNACLLLRGQRSAQMTVVGVQLS